ncbi:hypothetical protein ACDP63_25075 [Paracoccus sp. P2]|uniref:hypothetical protein n=1 Tax=Paracoccus sp. P2 TaxID=3248840 RepID=UPI00391FB190
MCNRVDLQQKIAARKRERELEEKQAEMRAWGVRGTQSKESPDEAEEECVDTDDLPVDEEAVDDAIFKAKLEGAHGFVQFLYYFLLALIALLVFAAVKATLFDGDLFGAIVFAIVALLLRRLNRGMINSVTPPDQSPPAT